MRTDVQITPNGGDPAEQALMEEFASYLALLSQNAIQPMIAEMREHQNQLKECMVKVEQHHARQSALISRWMMAMLVVLVAEGCLIVKLLIR